MISGTRLNATFLENHIAFTPGFVSPPVLVTYFNGILLFNLRADNSTLLKMINPDFTDSNIQGKLFDLLLGSWTCVQSNSYGTTNATTRILDCKTACLAKTISFNFYQLCIGPKNLNFEVGRVFVNESDGAVQICVHRNGRVNNFRVYTTDIDAHGE